MTKPPDRPAQLVAWSEDLVERARSQDDPYVVNAALQARLAEFPRGAPEREAIYDLLISWLGSDDMHRWHPALMVLLDEAVVRAAPAVRSAGEAATTEDKRAHARVFDQIADALERPTIDVDPATAARWEAFDAALLKAATLLPAEPGRTARSSTVEHFVDDGDGTNALFFAAGGVERADGRPEALAVAELLIPEFELWLDEATADELSERDRIGLNHTLDRLRAVVSAHAAGTAVPPEFRSSFSASWKQFEEGTELEAQAACLARLRALSPDAPERRWILDILLGWLYSDDPQRWKGALAVLEAEGVQAAAPEMRFAASVAFPADKRAATADFEAAADAIEGR